MTTTRTALDIVATTPDAQTDAERHAALLGDLGIDTHTNRRRRYPLCGGAMTRRRAKSAAQSAADALLVMLLALFIVVGVLGSFGFFEPLP